MGVIIRCRVRMAYLFEGWVVRRIGSIETWSSSWNLRLASRRNLLIGPSAPKRHTMRLDESASVSSHICNYNEGSRTIPELP